LLPFLLLLRRPPMPPLFPYTTLFRSDAARTARGKTQCAIVQRRHVRIDALEGNTRKQRRNTRPRYAVERNRARTSNVGLRRHRRDRKSTRLNSSHVQISYADFRFNKR